MSDANNVLILYSEVFSSLSNMNYWREKIGQQLRTESTFGLVAVINSKTAMTPEREKLRSYSESWMKGLRPALEKNCHGYAIVVERKEFSKYNLPYLKKIEETVGCKCQVFDDLDEAIYWCKSPPIES